MGINLIRRGINRLLNIPEMEGISLVIKISPNKKMSGMDFNILIDEIIKDVEIDLENFVLEDEKLGRFSFDVITEYDVFEDEYLEIYDEAEEDLNEEVSLENRAKNVTIELTPKNDNHLVNKTDEILYLVIKSFNKLIFALSKKIAYSAKFIFEIRYKKGTLKQVKRITESLNNVNQIKVYFREYTDFDKINIVMPFDEINDNKTLSEIIGKIK